MKARPVYLLAGKCPKSGLAHGHRWR